jgi:hypothetical protein
VENAGACHLTSQFENAQNGRGRDALTIEAAHGAFNGRSLPRTTAKRVTIERKNPQLAHLAVRALQVEKFHRAHMR